MLWMSVPSTDMPSGKPLAGMKLPSRCVRPNSTYSSSAGRSGRAVGLGVEEEVEVIDFGQRTYPGSTGGEGGRSREEGRSGASLSLGEWS